MRSAAVLAVVMACCGACEDFPKDANSTLQRVQSGQPLRVGWLQADPWVRPAGTDGPAGLEPDLVRAWAKTLQTRIDWVTGSEAQLAKALQEYALDVAVAGFTKDTPWGGKIGQTQPYLETGIVVGLADGTPEPASWDGVEIRYDRRRPHFAGPIRGIGARPMPVDAGDLAPIGAAYAEELPALGLIATEKTLASEERVIATAPAENALTLELDRFLHARRQSIAQQLAASARQ